MSDPAPYPPVSQAEQPNLHRRPSLHEPKKDGNYTSLIACFVLCFAVAAAASAVTIPNLAPWYESLAKPGFTPANWVFGPVWAVLYALMAVSLWLAWTSPAARSLKFPALFIFGVQLLLNAAWPLAFFGAQSPGLALLVILLLIISIAATIFSFYRIRALASLLLVPYLAWICYAGVLNLTIWWMN
ncbi:tryptophan-rich sensory protein [Rhodoligotrophos appendicifer]|uniref:TspO/MBR family protein n=1 Tax=Rhodoligotrophos appendicifer TaxID=987056 RepID=UPI001186FAEB|nr:TspO/MBR family protein [Rhodoligotrophos appendicifer]